MLLKDGCGQRQIQDLRTVNSSVHTCIAEVKRLLTAMAECGAVRATIESIAPKRVSLGAGVVRSI